MIEAYENIKKKLGEETAKSWEKLIGFIRAYYIMEELWDGKEILKFRRSGKTLVTLCVQERRFNALVIFGKVERENFESVRDNFSDYICSYYDNSRTYHDGKWMFIDVDGNTNVDELIELLKIKKTPNRKIEKLKEEHIGSCGNRCDQCLLRATNGGIENRVLFTNECYKIYFSPDEAKEDYSNVNCTGCYAGCVVKDCAKGKGHDLCVQCEDYPCEKVSGVFTYPGKCNVGLTTKQLDLLVIPYCGKERFERCKAQLCKNGDM